MIRNEIYFYKLLRTIQSQPEIATLKFERNRNWLHYLCNINSGLPLSLSTEIDNTIQHLVQIGISLEERADDGCRPMDKDVNVVLLKHYFPASELHELQMDFPEIVQVRFLYQLLKIIQSCPDKATRRFFANKNWLHYLSDKKVFLSKDLQAELELTKKYIIHQGISPLECSDQGLRPGDVNEIVLLSSIYPADILDDIYSRIPQIRDKKYFYGFLKSIQSSPTIPRTKFKGNKNWLHYLHDPTYPLRMVDMEELKKTIDYVIRQGVSPYERSDDGSLPNDKGVNRLLLPEVFSSKQLAEIKEYFPALNEKGYFYELLKKIKSSKLISGIRFRKNRSWLYYLVGTVCTLPYGMRDEVKSVIEYILQEDNNVSAYDRDLHDDTAFMYIPANDPNGFSITLRPYDGLIGIDSQIETMKAFLHNVATNPSAEVQTHFIIFYGPPGIGKIKLASQICLAHGFELREFNSGAKEDQLLNQYENRISEFFKAAKDAKSPICLFMDEIDSICPQLEGSAQSGFHDSRKAVNLIQKEIQNLVGTQVVVFGATNYLALLSSAIKDRASTLHFPTLKHDTRRKIILDKLRRSKVQDYRIIDKIADVTPAWSARRIGSYIDKVIASVKESRQLTNTDFVNQFSQCRKGIQEDYQALLQVATELPDLAFRLENDVEVIAEGAPILSGFASELKSALRMSLTRLRKPELFTARYSDVEPIDILLYGPPGTGKTYFAKVLAKTANVFCVIINAGDFKTSEKIKVLKKIFSTIQEQESVIVFIDEIDSITQLGSLSKELIQTSITETHEKTLVVFIGATNYLHLIDTPIKSRFGSHIEVPLPTLAVRQGLFHGYLAKIKGLDHKLTLRSTETELAQMSAGLSVRDISMAIKEAVLKSIASEAAEGRYDVPIRFEDFQAEILKRQMVSHADPTIRGTTNRYS